MFSSDNSYQSNVMIGNWTYNCSTGLDSILNWRLNGSKYQIRYHMGDSTMLINPGQSNNYNWDTIPW